MIELWSWIDGFGYQKDSDGISYRCCNGFVFNTVAESRPRLAGGKYQIDIYVSIDNQFADPPASHVLMSGHLSSSEVVTDFDNKGTPLWDEKEQEAAAKAFMVHGLSWIRQVNDLKWLIEFFESGLKLGVGFPQAPPRERSRYLSIFNMRNREVGSANIRRPPIFKYHLALLYYVLGDYERGCRHAMDYLNFITMPACPIEGQVRAVNRLIQAMRR